MRNEIIKFLEQELIGPDPIPPFVQKNGEEVLFETPRQRYGAGILYPQKFLMENSDKISDEEQSVLNSSQYDFNESEEAIDRKKLIENRNSNYEDREEGFEELINLANAYFPSAMGFSCFVQKPEEGLIVEIKAGRYRRDQFVYIDRNNKEINRKGYLRESINELIHVKTDEIPCSLMASYKRSIQVGNSDTGLVLYITNRSGDWDDEKCLLTFSLVNELQGGKEFDESEKCFFQVEMSVRSKKDQEACFCPYKEEKCVLDEDDEINQLLYRKYKNYAIGHGCAVSWDEVLEDRTKSLRTSIMPAYEMKPILPTKLDGVELSMFNLGYHGDFEEGLNNLEILCSQYHTWIKEQEKQISSLEIDLQKTAKNQIENCNRCLDRMMEGIEILKSNEKVKLAFQYMNTAMLIQQLRYSLPLRKWYQDKTENIAPFQDIDLFDDTTWPRKGMGFWRPFQIAFILMNLRSIVDPKSVDREIVDIIWFPTGGGKTEAYLGLTAFTIFLRRLNDPSDSGTSVLMRYTLRLLTAQQFQRAAALITACESIRLEFPNLLGNDPITIGLWVGEKLSPNTCQEAIKTFESMKKNNKKDDNAFVVLKCPWCGAQMGPVKKGYRIEIKGYRMTKKNKMTNKTVVFECSDKQCTFGNEKKGDRRLPLLVIDEDIYKKPPALIISTVDKFAMLPWKEEARTLFGFREEGINVSPPELIIQDELHLISGPLGSMVGHYETLIASLCKNHKTGAGPKIIASTATISRAREQAHALFNCGENNVFQFPPQCIDAGESFFAHVAHDSVQNPGRIYVGVHASGLPSHATAQVRVISALLQSIKMIEVKDEEKKDYYHTIVNYFNSLRELGHAATLVAADIPEYISAMWKRKEILSENEKKRFIFKMVELTSRVSSSDIPNCLQELELKVGEGKDKPVDICLATNMISVGLDISRLGLMTVIGQPKTTSEYIQATSRVGRDSRGPGLVFVIYNTSKPRDRSIYEQFFSYHSKIYSFVEPTSITPFATPVRERALHALIAGLVRFLGEEGNIKSPYPVPSKRIQSIIKDLILDRVKAIDTNEYEATKKLIEERFGEWIRYSPLTYGNPMGQNSNNPLLYPAGFAVEEEIQNKAWATPTSMRNVDVECVARVINDYPLPEER